MIFILVDLFENLDKFIDSRMSFAMVASYYFTFIPEIVRLVMPISVLLSTLFTAGRLINFNEIIAIKNAGISLNRFMAPFIVMGLIITSISMYFNNWIVPEANKKKTFVERNYLGKNVIVTGFNKLYFQDSPNQLLLIESFRETDLSANKVSVLMFKPDSSIIMTERVDADLMKWTDNKWVFYKAIQRTFTAGSEEVKSYDSVSCSDVPGLNKINILPGEITKKQLTPDEMNYPELNNFIDSQVRGGQNVDKLLVDFYSKISFPFSNLIVIVFGISISTGSKRRKGLALQFGISMLVTFVYLGFVKISQSFGYNGDLNPVFTAWLANIIFVVFGAGNLLARNY